MPYRLCIRVVLVATAAPLTAAAQHLRVAPIVGYYAPLARQQLYEIRNSASSSALGVDTVRTTIEPAIAFGLKVALEVGACCGVELSATMSETTRREAHMAGVTLPLGSPPLVRRGYARSTFVAAQFLVQRRVGGALTMALGAGPSLTRVDGLAYRINGPAGRSVLGMAFATNLSYALGARLRLDVGVRDYAYRLDFGDPGPPPDVKESGLQHDLITAVGVAFSLGR